jgi:galactokinase
MLSLIHQANNAFKLAMGKEARYVFQAPGRVNLIGEHTDYNDGFVLPCAIDYCTVIVANARKDNKVKVLSVDYDNQIDEFDLHTDITKSDKPWANYVRGVVQQLQVKGYKLSGLEMAISGNVPQGAGLSSSASLEVAVAQAFTTICNLPINQQEIALIGQAAENTFVGCQCGIMDQLISAKAIKHHALLIDCRTLDTNPVPLPANMTLLIVNSNKARGLVESEYNTRREQCEAAAKFFNVTALRDVSLSQFEAQQSLLDPVIAKRAKHVISENARTLEAVQAMKNSDIDSLQALMEQSHISMKNDFEITLPEIDTLVDIIKSSVGRSGGARMTGGGFGGCVVSLLPTDSVETVIQAIEEQYPAQTGLRASIYLCSAESGASELKEDKS